MKPRKIAIGADHKGFKLKEEIKKKLSAEGHSVTDLGGFSEDSVDYPEFACKVAQHRPDCLSAFVCSERPEDDALFALERPSHRRGRHEEFRGE